MATPLEQDPLETQLPEWQLLTEAEQNAYLNAHRVERARSLLGFAAVSSLSHGESSADLTPLREQLITMPLAHVSEIAKTVEMLGKQLGVKLFQTDPILLKQSEQSNAVVPIEKATELEVTQQVNQALVKTKISTKNETNVDDQPEMDVTKQHRHQTAFFLKLFGADQQAAYSNLNYKDAMTAFEQLMSMYIAKNRKTSLAMKQVERARAYMYGTHEVDIAIQLGATEGAIKQGRYNIIKILKREYSLAQLLLQLQLQNAAITPIEIVSEPGLDIESLPSSSLSNIQEHQLLDAVMQQHPESELVAITKAVISESTANVEKPSSLEQLRATVLEYADAIGMKHSVKIALLERLQSDKPVMLTPDAETALGELSHTFKSCFKREIDFTHVEIEVLKLFLAQGVAQGQKPLPVHYILSRVNKYLIKEQQTIDEVLISIFSKFTADAKRPIHAHAI